MEGIGAESVKQGSSLSRSYWDPPPPSPESLSELHSHTNITPHTGIMKENCDQCRNTHGTPHHFLDVCIYSWTGSQCLRCIHINGIQTRSWRFLLLLTGVRGFCRLQALWKRGKSCCRQRWSMITGHVIKEEHGDLKRFDFTSSIRATSCCNIVPPVETTRPFLWLC